MTLQELREDRQASLMDVPKYDFVNYSGLAIIGIYYDIDDKVIVRNIQGKITMLKIRYPKSNDRAYFIKENKRYHIDEFI